MAKKTKQQKMHKRDKIGKKKDKTKKLKKQQKMNEKGQNWSKKTKSKNCKNSIKWINLEC